METSKLVGQVRVPVIEAPALKNQTPVVVGVMSMEQLWGRWIIPHREHKTQQGYQREAAMPRVRQLASEIKKGRVDLPTSLLFNARDFNPKHNFIYEGNQLILKSDGPFYVVDGQHRIEALRLLMEEDPDRWSTFRFSFVCMLGATELEEMEQFYTVNSKAKSVRTDLALDILRQRAMNDPSVWEALEEQNQDWKVRAQSLAQELNAKSEVWKGRIRFAGSDKAGTLISNAGMVTSLKPLYNFDLFDGLKLESQLNLIDAYWQGVAKVLPGAFEEATDYGIQKQTGAVVMHAILPRVVLIVQSKGESLLAAQSYANVLTLLAQFTDFNSSGERVQGSDFWLAGASGAAGSYTSGAGQRVLTKRLLSHLPHHEIN